MKQYNFWKHNRKDQHHTKTLDEIKSLFTEWLPTKDHDWLDYYNGERVIRHFIAIDDKGMLSVFEENEFDDIYRALEPIYMSYTYPKKSNK